MQQVAWFTFWGQPFHCKTTLSQVSPVFFWLASLFERGLCSAALAFKLGRLVPAIVYLSLVDPKSEPLVSHPWCSVLLLEFVKEQSFHIVAFHRLKDINAPSPGGLERTPTKDFVFLYGKCALIRKHLSGVIRANRFARFARIGWFARIGNSSDSGEAGDSRYKHRAFNCEWFVRMIRANRYARIALRIARATKGSTFATKCGAGPLSHWGLTSFRFSTIGEITTCVLLKFSSYKMRACMNSRLFATGRMYFKQRASETLEAQIPPFKVQISSFMVRIWPWRSRPYPQSLEDRRLKGIRHRGAPNKCPPSHFSPHANARE